ncbi:SLAM family member 9 isoform X2 [Amia ocellicauda]|uniref:SLAM family member 9 isoform X2 n=1 Tax=Amia ocellicauda TaxID=2972642 RepID=UPI003463A7A0
MSALLSLAVLGWFQLSGADGPATDVYVAEGESVHLDVPGYQNLQFNILEWISQLTNSIMLEYDRSTVKNYAEHEKVGFSAVNLSILLKNAQVDDSGLYTAEVTDSKGQRHKVAEYRLHVQEAITSSSHDGRNCSVTLKCSVTSRAAVSIHWTWTDGNSGNEVTHNGSLLDLPLSPSGHKGSSLACHAHNKISNVTITVPQITCQYSATVSGGFPVCLWKTIMFSIGLVIMLSAVVGVHIREVVTNKKECAAEAQTSKT